LDAVPRAYTFRLELLGGFRLVFNGAAITRPLTVRQQQLLTYLALHADGPFPLQQIAGRIGEIRPHANEKVVVHCKSGGRSMQFTQILRQQGFKDVKSMAGGILLWNKDINPGGPQY